MKKLIFTLTCAAALLFTANVSAQIGFGGRVGINLAKQSFDDGDESLTTDAKVGLDIAAVANIGLTDLLSLQPELHFLQKGGKLEMEEEFFGQTFSVKQDITINYLEIPVHLKASFGTETVKGFVLAGPSIGFGLSGEGEYCEDGECQTQNLDFDDDGIKRTDFGLSLGAGVGFAAGPGQLFVDVRYLLGLSNIDDSGFDSEVKNTGVQIGLGYMITIGN